MTVPQVVELIGHYNPVHEYPHPVIPVFRMMGALWAAYWAEGVVQFEEVPEGCDIVEHSEPVARGLGTYDAAISALFAFTPERVVAYRRNQADEFFAYALRREELAGANPFFKLALARAALGQDGITEVVRSCILELGANRSGFAETWYESRQHELPGERTSVHDMLEGLELFSIAGMPTDAPLLLALSRAANDRRQSPDNVFVVPEVRDWLPASAQEVPVGLDAVLSELEPNTDDEATVALGSSELVLAVREGYLRERGLQPSWEAVFHAGMNDEAFRWVRPRAQSPAGSVLEAALDGVFDEDANRLGGFPRRILAERVLQFAGFDQQAVNAGLESDAWKVDAIVTKRHAAPEVFRHLDSAERAVLISYREPLLVDYGLLLGRRARSGAKAALARSLPSLPVAAHRLRSLGMHPPGAPHRVAAAGNLLARAASERAVAVYVLADVSSSMQGQKLEAAKQGMTAFLGLLSSERTDAVGLITFSSHALHVVPLGRVADVGDEVESHIRNLRAGGRTALLSAVAMACNDLSRWSSHARAVVLLTDGHENASTIDVDGLEQVLTQQSEAPMILSVAYGDDADYVLLRRLAELTRGTALRGTVLNIGQLYQHMMRLL